jgi:hypothetical protein
MSDVSAEIQNFLRHHQVLTPEKKTINVHIKTSVHERRSSFGRSYERRKSPVPQSKNKSGMKEISETESSDLKVEETQIVRESLLNNKLIIALSQEPMVVTHRVGNFKDMFSDCKLEHEQPQNSQTEMHQILKTVSLFL